MDALAFSTTHFPWRPLAAKQLILVSCSVCPADGTGSTTGMDYTDIQRTLLDAGITLHLIDQSTFKLPKSSRLQLTSGSRDSQSETIYGLDSETIYRPRDVTQRSLIGAPDLRFITSISIPSNSNHNQNQNGGRKLKNVCHSLAQEVHGSLWSLNNNLPGDKTWRTLLARRVATPTPTATGTELLNQQQSFDYNNYSNSANCMICDCAVASPAEFVGSGRTRSICRPCRSRDVRIPAPGQLIQANEDEDYF